MKKILLILFLVNTLIEGVSAQKKSIQDSVRIIPPSIGVVLGYNFYNSKTIEIGIGIQPMNFYAAKKYSGFERKRFIGFLISYEIPIIEDNVHHLSFNEFLMDGFYATGLNLNYNYNNAHGTLGLKPMLGLSYRHFAIMWGYNFFLTKNYFDNLKHNEWTIRTYIPIVNFKKK